jgi:hypothetical protein
LTETVLLHQKIGKAYRGWVETEAELDMLLTLHKQQTQSFFGTRQSPSSSKPSCRLMWKSQYVPFDGVPFVNSGGLEISLCTLAAILSVQVAELLLWNVNMDHEGKVALLLPSGLRALQRGISAKLALLGLYHLGYIL